jgi:hypothetical protein
MSIAKEVNNRLDELLNIRAEIKRVDNDIKDGQILNNVADGTSTNKEGVIKIAEAMIDQIKNDLNKITNNGKSITGIYNNEYYVNDMIQDKIIVDNNLLN